MEKEMEIIEKGYIGTSIGVHSFIPSLPKASLKRRGARAMKWKLVLCRGLSKATYQYCSLDFL